MMRGELSRTSCRPVDARVRRALRAGRPGGRPVTSARRRALRRRRRRTGPGAVGRGSSRYVVTIHAEARRPAGEQVQNVTLTSDRAKRRPVLSAPSLVVLARYADRPERLPRGSRAPNHPSCPRGSGRRGRRWHLSVESSDADFSTTLSTIEDGREYDVASGTRASGRAPSTRGRGADERAGSDAIVSPAHRTDASRPGRAHPGDPGDPVALLPSTSGLMVVTARRRGASRLPAYVDHDCDARAARSRAASSARRRGPRVRAPPAPVMRHRRR